MSLYGRICVSEKAVFSHILWSAPEFKTVFSVCKFDSYLVFILQTMTRFNVRVTYMHVNFIKDAANLLLKYIVPKDVGILTTSSVSLIEYWVFPQH